MPLFGQKRASNERRKSNNLQTGRPLPENLTNANPKPLLPPPPPEANNAAVARAHVHSMIPSRKELLFHCQLAHGSPTKQIKDFSNVKELYQRIVEAFSLSQNEVIFCTLNTHKIDMSCLLGAQIGLEDFIFAHIKGQQRRVVINKSEPSLGLTITDNGTGFAFVKRIRDTSIVARYTDICVGDLIESINGRSMIGTRHYAVAKLLKELPQFMEITLELIEPKKAFDAIGPRNRGGAPMGSVMEGDRSKLEEALVRGEGRATLKMRRDGQAVVEEVNEWELRAADKVDDLLESFMGIRDTELAQTMVDMAKRKNFEDFTAVMNDQLGEFEFPEDFVRDVWTATIIARGT